MKNKIKKEVKEMLAALGASVIFWAILILVYLTN